MFVYQRVPNIKNEFQHFFGQATCRQAVCPGSTEDLGTQGALAGLDDRAGAGRTWRGLRGKMARERWKNVEKWWKNRENQTTWETNGETHENGVKNGKGWHRMVKNGWIFGWYRELFGDLYRISPANKNSGWFRIYINDKFGIWPTTNQKSWVVLFSGFKVISGNKSSEAYVRKLTPFGQQRMNRPIGYINCHHVPAKKMRLAPPLF